VNLAATYIYESSGPWPKRHQTPPHELAMSLAIVGDGEDILGGGNVVAGLVVRF